MKKRKVLFISKYYKPHIGGVEKHVEKISQELIKKDYEITVLTENHTAVFENSKISSKRIVNLKNQETIDDVKVIRIAYPKIKFFGLFKIWSQLFKQIDLFKNADIIHIHDVFIWYLPLKFILPKKKVFTSFHGWEGQYPIPLKNILYKKLAAKLSKKNICVGKYIEKYYGIKADRITYGAVSIPKVKSDLKSKVRNSIVYVGRLETDTGLKVFLKALENLPGYNVDFCGNGPLADECAKYGKVHGFCDPQPYLIKAQFCFAGGYLTALEAMANQCVVLTAYDNLLSQNYWQLVPFKDFIILADSGNSLSQEILAISQEPKKLEQITTNAFKWVKQQNWNDLAQIYTQLWL